MVATVRPQWHDTPQLSKNPKPNFRNIHPWLVWAWKGPVGTVGQCAGTFDCSAGRRSQWTLRSLRIASSRTSQHAVFLLLTSWYLNHRLWTLFFPVTMTTVGSALRILPPCVVYTLIWRSLLHGLEATRAKTFSTIIAGLAARWLQTWTPPPPNFPRRPTWRNETKRHGSVCTGCFGNTKICLF